MRFLCSIFMCVILAATVFWYFGTHKTAQGNNKKFTIVCTTTILADTIRNVVGDHAAVISLMGPGVDPHLYRAREGDVHRLASADLVFYHGLHLEGKLATILESLERYAPTYAVSDVIPKDLLRRSHPLASYEAAADPHIWHAVPLWIRVVAYVADCCAQHDPVNAIDYYANADAYIHQLLELHIFMLDIIASIPFEQRILVTAHDAFGYFGATYGLEVVALQGISTEAEIGAWDVANLVDLIVQKKVPALFVETAIPHRMLQAVIDAVQVRGHSVRLGDELYADALGDAQSDVDTYAGMLQHNVGAIVSGLGNNSIIS